MVSIWDHDLWQEIYEIQDVKTCQAIADIYRLVLDMREKDILAAKIAEKVNMERKLILSRGQRVAVGLFSFLVGTAEILQLIHYH